MANREVKRTQVTQKAGGMKLDDCKEFVFNGRSEVIHERAPASRTSRSYCEIELH